jgi:FkbM family methyltransferase
MTTDVVCLAPTSLPSRVVESSYMAVKQCRHGTMMYNVNDTFIGRSLDLYGEWCEAEAFLLGQILKPNDVVVDVGANIGTHTLFFAKAVGEKGVVAAFEPQRLAFQTLCGNVALNGLTNVTCLMAAVGEKRGQATIPRLDPRKPLNFGLVQAQTQGAGEVVDVVPIDEFGLERCSLIKVDVEGMEASVVRGATETIARCRPALFLENDTVHRSRSVLEAVEAIGYKAFWHVANYFNPSNFFGNRENVFARFHPEANILCVPKECPFTGLHPVEGLDDDWKKAVARMARGRAPTTA